MGDEQLRKDYIRNNTGILAVSAWFGILLPVFSLYHGIKTLMTLPKEPYELVMAIGLLFLGILFFLLFGKPWRNLLRVLRGKYKTEEHLVLQKVDIPRVEEIDGRRIVRDFGERYVVTDKNPKININSQKYFDSLEVGKKMQVIVFRHN